jgi:hypothetical protein
MNFRTLIARIIVLLTLGSLTWLIFTAPAAAQGLGFGLGSSVGGFSSGIGFYQAPSDAISDSGIFSFARYELSNIGFELDYGLSNQNFMLGSLDYLYRMPTASGVTRTEIALGGGLTFVNQDPSLDESKFGPNLLGQIKFMENLGVQLRYDFLEGDADLWTFGLSYGF